jgi:hypothetical protein
MMMSIGPRTIVKKATSPEGSGFFGIESPLENPHKTIAPHHCPAQDKHWSKQCKGCKKNLDQPRGRLPACFISLVGHMPSYRTDVFILQLKVYLVNHFIYVYIEKRPRTTRTSSSC